MEMENLGYKYAISVVIPVKTSAYYFSKAIDSILNQTFQNFEIILVDDNCCDFEVQTILSRLLKNSRITVLHNTYSLGAAESRNVGLSIVRGEYVIFLDSDDLFDSTLLEKLFLGISKNQSDICFCEWKSFEEINEKIIFFERERLIIHDTINPMFEINVMDKVGTIPWNKLVRVDYLKNNGILFQNLSSSNDVFFSCATILLAEHISCVREPLVYYRENNMYSISRTRDSRNLFSAVCYFFNYYIGKRTHISKEITCAVMSMLIGHINYEIENCASFKQNMEFVKSVLELSNEKKESLNIESINRINRINTLGIWIYVFWHMLKSRIKVIRHKLVWILN